MIKFERVSRFEKDEEVIVPTRATKNSAGYDFCVAEDTIVPSYQRWYDRASCECDLTNYAVPLEDIASIVKRTGGKPTLVSTGIKCSLEPDIYLELSVRSSTPLKNLIIMANGVGIIDSDYYNNKDNEGEIFFQLLNLTPWDIQLKKGDRIGQGIIKKYLKTVDDKSETERIGGFGSSGN